MNDMEKALIADGWKESSLVGDTIFWKRFPDHPQCARNRDKPGQQAVIRKSTPIWNTDYCVYRVLVTGELPKGLAISIEVFALSAREPYLADGIAEINRAVTIALAAWSAAAGATTTNAALLECLRGLLAFHPTSPETGAELPIECWTPEYRQAVERAERALSSHGHD